MPKAAGRSYLLKKGGTVIGGVKALSMKMDSTPIDVTDNDSAGVQTLLTGAAASKTLSIDVSGVYTDNVLRAIMMDPAADRLLTDLTFTHGGSGASSDVITGNFFITNYTDTATHDGPGEFSATFTSSGNWTAA
jgi:predicted secreted protein